MDIDKSNLEPLFTSSLKINYDERFITTAQNFIESLSLSSGCSENEIYQLSLVVEDTLVFIISKYLDSSNNHFIEIDYSVFSEFVEINITNVGPPIHVNDIPIFSIDEPNTEDGLWYQMAGSLTDKFEFINRYDKGWVIKITKNVSKITFKKREIKDRSDTLVPNGEITIRVAIPDDAKGLIDLAYSTYRYSYGRKTFYDINSLRKQIEEGIDYIYVAVMNNQIIGSSSIKYYNNKSPFGESGSAMVVPAYRRTSAMLLLIRAIAAHHIENPRNKDFFVCELVTTHTLSQRGAARINHGYKPFSISLNFMMSPEFLEMEGKPNSYETILYSVYFIKKLRINSIYTDLANKSICQELFANADCEIEVLTDTAKISIGDTEIVTFPTNSVGVPTVKIISFGVNWISEIRKTLYNLTTTGVKTIILQVPSNKPLPENFAKEMLNLNLIFTGLFLNTLDEISLFYIFTTSIIDFDSIKLDSPVAKNLLEVIKEQYNIISGK